MGVDHGTAGSGEEPMPDLRRRQFITLLGGVAAWPLAARARQPAVPVIGFVTSLSARDFRQTVAAFHRGLNEAAFIRPECSD